MSRATVIYPTEFAGFGILSFANTLIALTRHSGHSYEQTVNRLLSDMETLHHSQQLDTGSYHAILGKSADVADFFNYDLEALPDEPNSWYRASIIHQMGIGMLQALERLRPDLACMPFFSEAVSGLKAQPKTVGTQVQNSGPLSYRCWAANLPQN